jgi:hypothetical protein
VNKNKLPSRSQVTTDGGISVPQQDKRYNIVPIYLPGKNKENQRVGVEFDRKKPIKRICIPKENAGSSDLNMFVSDILHS